MGDALDWPTAFVALGAAMGEPVAALASALGPEATPAASSLLAVLGSDAPELRNARARALADAGVDLLAALDSWSAE